MNWIQQNGARAVSAVRVIVKEKTMVYEFLKMMNGDLYVCRGGLNDAGVDAKDLFMMRITPSNTTIYTAFTRADSSMFFKGATTPVKINQAQIELRFNLGEESDIVKQVIETDKKADAAKSGIILADGMKEGV